MNHRTWITLGAVATLLVATLFAAIGFVSNGANAAGSAKYSVKDIMVKAHKEGLLKKVLKGQADLKEKQQLLELYLSLWDYEPVKGDMDSWMKKSGDLIVAASRVVLDEKGSVDALKAAANCKGCHAAHKPKKKK